MNVFNKSNSRMFYKNINKSTSNNYYTNFHKDASFSPQASKIENVLIKSPDEEKSLIPPPFFKSGAEFVDRYAKQVVSILLDKTLLNSPHIMEEAKVKAKSYLNIKNFAIGAYSESKGILPVRKNLAAWYEERDGFKADEDDFYLTYGKLNSYDHVISTICQGGEGLLVPNPCYPFYLNYNTASGIENVFYNFEDIMTDKSLKVNFTKAEDSILRFRKENKPIKAMVVINPNLPLGNVLNYAEMEKIVKFCEANKLALIVCESLQHSLYNRSHDVDYSNKASEGDNIKQENQFHSFRQVIQRLNSELELFSLNSISDGPFFHGSIQSGYVDCLNVDKEVKNQLYKYKSIDLCSGIAGQIFLDLYLKKPKELGETFINQFEKSFNDFNKQIHTAKDEVLNHLKSDNEIQVRDIQAGYTFFVKTLNKNKKIFIDGIPLKRTPGRIYGVNLEEYMAIYMNESLLKI